ERTPAELQIHVTCTDIKYRRGLPVGLTMHYEVMRGDLLLAVASTAFNCHTPALYQRLRVGRGNVSQMFWNVPEPAPPLSKELCRRDRMQDVVLSPTGEADRWQLRVDTSHPVLFDHPVDHVPGMLLLEAARQAAFACTPATAAYADPSADAAGSSATPAQGPCWPVSMDVGFRRYVEFDSPCWITAEATRPQTAGHDRGLRVTAVQGDDPTPAFTATVALARRLP
ncbi:AfsA-related hotdog domain-containing protein, partial [Streptomyces sp. NPDC002073]